MRKKNRLLFLRRLLPVALAFLFPACSLISPHTEGPTPTISPTFIREIESSPTSTRDMESSPVSTAEEPTLARPTVTRSSPQETISHSPSPTPCARTRGLIQSFSLNSDILENGLEGRVYLPPCYGAGDQTGFPVLYLLHGVTASDEQWIDLGVDEAMDDLIAAGEIPPFIIVMPREYSWGLPAQNRFGDALIQDLLPWVDRHFRTRAEREYRAIGGLSRGGNWALHIGSREWHLFSAMGGHSAPVFFGDARDIPMWLGKIPEKELPRIYLDIGEDDQNQESTLALEQTLTEEGFPHDWHLYPGTHNEAYWREHLKAYLKWYASTWENGPVEDVALPGRID